ncbi:MAG: hypothetical protein CFE43_04490 [Burkholderiales bacterium PBB3]|nr:MAG: hypothetical protein CFE43_04490 [Burkholderiales bacterium PBB3]
MNTNITTPPLALRSIALLTLAFTLSTGHTAAVAQESPLVRNSKLEMDRMSNVQEWRLELKKTKATDPPNETFGIRQGLASALANAGDQDRAIAEFDAYIHLRNKQDELKGQRSSSAAPTPDDLAQLDAANVQDALSTIVEQARSRRIVILNEAHHVPMHRAFAMRLARELRKLGFDYLACETFRIDATDMLQAGHVETLTGYYSTEPAYVKFLIDAKASGWKFVSYEPRDDADQTLNTADWRETRMASNLVDRVFKLNPSAKLFVYVGYGHAQKLPASKGDADGSKMAAQLKRLTGHDPLSIDQTTWYGQRRNERDPKLYEHILRKIPAETAQPVILMGQDGRSLLLDEKAAMYDLQIVYPNLQGLRSYGRPRWMSSIGQYQPLPIPSQYAAIKGQQLLYVFRATDPINAMPVDVVPLYAGKPLPHAMVPAGTKGDYRFLVEK